MHSHSSNIVHPDECVIVIVIVIVFFVTVIWWRLSMSHSLTYTFDPWRRRNSLRCDVWGEGGRASFEKNRTPEVEFIFDAWVYGGILLEARRQKKKKANVLLLTPSSVNDRRWLPKGRNCGWKWKLTVASCNRLGRESSFIFGWHIVDREMVWFFFPSLPFKLIMLRLLKLYIWGFREGNVGYSSRHRHVSLSWGVLLAMIQLHFKMGR